jgi:hypothetical protein
MIYCNIEKNFSSGREFVKKNCPGSDDLKDTPFGVLISKGA